MTKSVINDNTILKDDENLTFVHKKICKFTINFGDNIIIKNVEADNFHEATLIAITTLSRIHYFPLHKITTEQTK